MAPRWVVLDSGQASSAAALLDVGGASRVADASLGTPSKESRKQHQRVPSFTAVNLGVAFAQLPGSGRKAESALAELWRRFVAQLRLLSSLTVQLGRFLRPSWLAKFAGLLAFAALLTPAFARVAFFYVTSRKVKRNLVYGPAPRNTLDLYLPDSLPAPAPTAGAPPEAQPPPLGRPSAPPQPPPAPLVIFVTGGMWIIGYKAWGALLASRLRAAGCVVACLDYRNFPQGTVSAMVSDVTQGVAFCLQSCGAWGADQQRVTLVGQSAGAHLCALALLQQAERERAGGPPESGEDQALRWPVSGLAGFVGVSGVYTPDDDALLDHFQAKGLYKEVVWSIMEAGMSGARAAEALPRASPVTLLRADAATSCALAAPSLPRVTLCHGTADASAPASQSAVFAAALRAAGASSVHERYYPGKSHTDPFLEDPIEGGSDALLEDILGLAHGEAAPRIWPRFPRMLPAPLVQLARRCIPF